MKDPIKTYPMAVTPYDRQNLPLQARMASTLASMGTQALTAKGSTYKPPTYGMGAFLLRQRARGLKP